MQLPASLLPTLHALPSSSIFMPLAIACWLFLALLLYPRLQKVFSSSSAPPPPSASAAAPDAFTYTLEEVDALQEAAESAREPEIGHGFRFGSRVEIHSLKKAPQLNGTYGIVLRCATSAGKDGEEPGRLVVRKVPVLNAQKLWRSLSAPRR